MSFLRLKLKRANIKESIDLLVGEDIVPKVRQNGKVEIYRYDVSSTSFVDVHYNTDDTTSITTGGKDKDVADLIASDIVEKCQTDLPEPKRALYLKNISLGTFNSIITELEAKGHNITLLPKIRIADKYQITNSHDEKITIHYYTSGAVNFQGRGYSVYADVADVLSSKLNLNDFLDSQIASNQVENISAEDLETAMQKAFSHSYNFIKGPVEFIISSSFFLTKIENPKLKDYTWMVYPMLRGLEGFLKLLLRRKSFTINDNFGEVFEPDTPGSPLRIVKPSVRNQFGDEALCEVLEECYRYLVANRHGLFHIDGIINATRILSKDDAIEMFNDIINLIEESYVKVTIPTPSQAHV